MRLIFVILILSGAIQAEKTWKGTFTLTPAEAADVITISESGNVTEVVQRQVDAQGEHVSIVFATAACELHGLKIRGKKSVRITSDRSCVLKYPAGKYDVDGQTNPETMIFFEDCENIIVDGRLITIDASDAKFVRPEGAGETLRWCWFVKGAGDLVEIRGLSNRHNAQPTLRVQGSKIGEGYQRVYISELRGEDVPAAVSVRGAHQHVIIEKIWNEDPQGLASWHPSAGIRTINVTSEVTHLEDHTKSVVIRDVYARWGLPGATVAQAAENVVISNVIADYHGFTSEGTDVDSNGGPIHKVDYVLFQPQMHGVPRSYVVDRLVTRNTNRSKGFISLWVGQAGDQAIRYSHCSFDTPVNAPGIGSPNRDPGGEGWSRIGRITDTDFYDRVFLGGNHHLLRDCTFMGPTIMDPISKRSQHDDFAKAFGIRELLRVRKDATIDGCDFYGARIIFDGKDTRNVLFKNCRFFNGSYCEATNHFSGEVEFQGCRNLDLRSAFQASHADVKRFVVDDPEGTFNVKMWPKSIQGNSVEVIVDGREVQPAR